MPINVKVVSESEFNDWLDFAKEECFSSGELKRPLILDKSSFIENKYRQF